jgi:hypothetical protein
MAQQEPIPDLDLRQRRQIPPQPLQQSRIRLRRWKTLLLHLLRTQPYYEK